MIYGANLSIVNNGQSAANPRKFSRKVQRPSHNESTYQAIWKWGTLPKLLCNMVERYGLHLQEIARSS